MTDKWLGVFICVQDVQHIDRCNVAQHRQLAVVKVQQESRMHRWGILLHELVSQLFSYKASKLCEGIMTNDHVQPR